MKRIKSASDFHERKTLKRYGIYIIPQKSREKFFIRFKYFELFFYIQAYTGPSVKNSEHFFIFCFSIELEFYKQNEKNEILIVRFYIKNIFF